MIEEEIEAAEREGENDIYSALDQRDISGVSVEDIEAIYGGAKDEWEHRLEENVFGPFSSGPKQSAEALATQFYRYGFHYFSEADVHEFLAFQYLYHFVHTKQNESSSGAGLNNGLETALSKVSRHLLSACPFWRDLDQVATGSECTASLLGEHCTLLSMLGENEEALSLIVELCLTTAKNFRGNPSLQLPDAALDDGTRPDIHTYHTGTNLSVEQQRQGCESCYTHLITSICLTTNISLEQRAGMLLLALQDPELGNDPCMLEILCEGLRGRYTEELLLNLPTGYVEDYLRRKDRGKLFEWYCRQGRQEQACGLMLELAYEDNGNPIAQRIQYLRQGLAVVPSNEYAVVERMLKFALIQSDAYIQVLAMTAVQTSLPIFTHQADEVGGISEQNIGARSRKAEVGGGQYYYDASPSKNRTPNLLLSQHKVPRLSPDGGVTGEIAASMHPGAQIRARDRENILENARYRLGFTLVSEGEWCSECFYVVRELHMWDINLHLLSLLDLHQVPGADEALVIRLWKSYIYRLVPLHSKDGPNSQVSLFSRGNGMSPR